MMNQTTFEDAVEAFAQRTRPRKDILVALAALVVSGGSAVLWWGAPESAVNVPWVLATCYTMFHLVVYGARRATGPMCRVPDAEDVEDYVLSSISPFVLAILTILWYFLA